MNRVPSARRAQIINCLVEGNSERMTDTHRDIATIFMHGCSQAVCLPPAFRLPGKQVRVRRVKRGILLEPMAPDLKAWFVALDRFKDMPFMEDWNRRCRVR